MESFFLMLLPALFPTAFFFCQATAATGNTRAVRPALWGAGLGIALAVSASLMESRFPDADFSLALFLLPVLVFAALLAFSCRNKKPVAPVAPRVRRVLGVLPLLFALAADSDAAGVLGAVALTEAAALSLFCAATGRLPAQGPLAVAGLTALNVATTLYLLRELFRMPHSFFFFAVFVPAAVPLWRQYRALPPDARLRGRLPGDARWALGLFAAVFPVLFLPRRGPLVLLLPVFVMTALACAVMGNTRAVRPGVFAGGTVLLCLWWFSTLGPLAGAVGGIVLLVLLVAPALVFALGLFAMVSEKAKTLPLPPVARIVLGVAGATGLAGFAGLLFR